MFYHYMREQCFTQICLFQAEVEVPPTPPVSNSELVKSRDVSSSPGDLPDMTGLWLATAFNPRNSTQRAGISALEASGQNLVEEEVKEDDPNEREISAIYTSWTRWSRCSRNCKQKRQRHCAVPAICGSAVIKMERGCHSDRCRGRDFHIVRKKKLRRKTKNHLKRNRSFYTKWSRWTPCTDFCETTRLKACRFPLVCGNNEVFYYFIFCTYISGN